MKSHYPIITQFLMHSKQNENTNAIKRFLKKKWTTIKISLDSKYYLMYKHPTEKKAVLSKDFVKFIGDKNKFDIGVDGEFIILRNPDKKIIAVVIKTKNDEKSITLNIIKQNINL